MNLIVKQYSYSELQSYLKKILNLQHVPAGEEQPAVSICNDKWNHKTHILFLIN